MRTATVYNFLLEANLMASLAIVLMAVVRKFLRKPLGSRAIYFAWLLVAVRLLCPLALPNPAINEIRSAFAPDEAIRPIAGQIQVRFRDAVEGVSDWLRYGNGGAARESALAQNVSALYDSTGNGMLSIHLMQVYLIGAGLVLCWFIASNLRFRHRLRADRIEPISGKLLEQYQALCEKRGVKPIPVYFTDPLPSACLAGVFKPYIALPLTAAPQEAIQVLAHEISHYKGRDHLWAVLRLLCCVVHWFNPLVWLAARMSRTDCELACDERTVEPLAPPEKLAYANVLVLAAAKRNAPGVAVLATGMTMTGRKLKTRVNSILHSGHTRRGLALAFTLLACMALVGAFATAEYPVRVTIPEMEQSEALPARAVTDDDSALARAKELWANDFLRADVSKAAWSVARDSGEIEVTATLPGTNSELWLRLKPDGSLAYLFNPDSGLASSYAAPSVMRDENFPQIERYLNDFNRAVLDGAVGFTHVRHDGESQSGGARFVSYAGMDENDQVVCRFEVELTPRVRVVSYMRYDEPYSDGQNG